MEQNTIECNPFKIKDFLKSIFYHNILKWPFSNGSSNGYNKYQLEMYETSVKEGGITIDSDSIFSSTKNFEYRILILGDFHIPHRAKTINPIIDRYLKKQIYSLVLCTGDLVSRAILDYIQVLGEFKVVRGNMDVLELPDKVVFKIFNKKIGMLHGTEIYPRGDERKIFEIAERLNLDIIITGHTHTSSIKKINKILMLNPGSITGVWGGGNYSGIPEFIEIEDIKPNELIIKLKKLINDELIEELYKIEIK